MSGDKILYFDDSNSIIHLKVDIVFKIGTGVYRFETRV